MTESEWLSCHVPRPMLEALRTQVSIRKLRLFVAACFGRMVEFHSNRGICNYIELVERYADGSATRDQLYDTGKQFGEWAILWVISEEPGDPWDEGIRASADVAYHVAYWTQMLWFRDQPDAARVNRDAAAREALRAQMQSVLHCAKEGEERHQVCILREVTGNPFRSVVFAPEWRTDTAVALARQMYEARDFSAMPILADALQDAGCDNEDVLNHCRGASAAHVRGCWVVDGVLGKE